MVLSFIIDVIIYLCAIHIFYQKGRKARDQELSENSVFYSNRPIEDIIFEARKETIKEARNKLYSMPAFLTVYDVMKLLDEMED